MRAAAPLAGQPWVGFLTLTTVPSVEWPELMAGWNNLLKWLRRRIPELQYCAVKEEGDYTGMKHLHVIAYPWVWVEQAELSAEWEALTHSKIVYIQRVGNEARVARYVAKYVSKSIPNLRKGVTWSRGWPKLPKQFRYSYLGPCAYPGSGVWLTSGAMLERGYACPCHGETGSVPWSALAIAAPWVLHPRLTHSPP